MDFIGEILATPFVCIGWIIVGAIAGTIARSIMGSRDQPLLSDLLLGIAGAIIGGLIAAILGLGVGEDASGIEQVILNLIIATIGAIILIAGRRALARAT